MLYTVFYSKFEPASESLGCFSSPIKEHRATRKHAKNEQILNGRLNASIERKKDILARRKYNSILSDLRAEKKERLEQWQATLESISPVLDKIGDELNYSDVSNLETDSNRKAKKRLSDRNAKASVREIQDKYKLETDYNPNIVSTSDKNPFESNDKIDEIQTRINKLNQNKTSLEKHLHDAIKAQKTFATKNPRYRQFDIDNYKGGIKEIDLQIEQCKFELDAAILNHDLTNYNGDATLDGISNPQILEEA